MDGQHRHTGEDDRCHPRVASLEVGGRYLDKTLAGATVDELRVFDQELSAAEMARLVRAGANAVRALFARTVTVRNTKGLRHA